ncbi:hypothetical protein IQC45_21910, partial [Leptospira interrogans serovar Pomona]|nr:hypothetical protein [Leptospira interrogans serovar Pomona]
MRFWIKLFWVLVFGTLAAFFYFCLHTLKERESLLVLDGSEELLDYTSGPGYVFECKTIFPWKYTVVRFPIFSKISNVALHIDLSSGLFPENSPQGKIKISLEVRYSFYPNKPFEFLEAAVIVHANIAAYIRTVVYSVIHKKV